MIGRPSSAVLVGSLALAAMSMPAVPAGLDQHGSYPRIMGMNIGGPSYYEGPDLQQQLSRHDVLILGFYPGWEGDGKNRKSMRDVLRNLKAGNPSITIGQYTILQESQDSDSHPSRERAAKITREKWWLMDRRGKRVRWSDDYGAWDINITAWTKADSSGRRYSEWLADYDYDTYFRDTPEFDIWYFDNALSRPASREGDWNLDGVNDSREDPDIAKAYREGQVRHWRRARELDPTKLLVGNSDDVSSVEFRGALNGVFLESIIGESWSTETRLGWDAAMLRYRQALAYTSRPNIVGFHVVGKADDYARMRYGLGSSLLDDGYFAYSERGSNYRNVMWFDEFDLDLGLPLEPPTTQPWIGHVYRRNFEHGLVLVNPSALPASVDVEPGYRRFSGRQDRVVNDGAPARQVRLGPKDAILLLKEQEP